jgi:hypothetical protein
VSPPLPPFTICTKAQLNMMPLLLLLLLLFCLR